MRINFQLHLWHQKQQAGSYILSPENSGKFYSFTSTKEFNRVHLHQLLKFTTNQTIGNPSKPPICTTDTLNCECIIWIGISQKTNSYGETIFLNRYHLQIFLKKKRVVPKVDKHCNRCRFHLRKNLCKELKSRNYGCLSKEYGLKKQNGATVTEFGC